MWKGCCIRRCSWQKGGGCILAITLLLMLLDLFRDYQQYMFVPDCEPLPIEMYWKYEELNDTINELYQTTHEINKAHDNIRALETKISDEKYLKNVFITQHPEIDDDKISTPCGDFGYWYEFSRIPIKGNRSLIYSHIFKSYGTSIRSWLSAVAKKNSLPDLTMTEARREPWHSMEYLIECHNRGECIWMAAVRDPVDRFISAFHEEGRRGKLKRYAAYDDPLKNLQTMLDYFWARPRRLGKFSHFIPQACFLSANPTVPSALDHITYLYRSETATKWFPELITSLGLESVTHTDLAEWENLRNRSNVDYQNPKYYIESKSALTELQTLKIKALYYIDEAHFHFSSQPAH
eukprot:TRINITY_DN14440_c0_g1_i1.p1 TRINITY_DN14440_c0_g1~~TRINITY_DN14440_c0_g1_i1.p1  ORF type:complete len:350 (-),score=31.10 TRINITY_DN14440_c0_g1_i1:109-1158(-)